MHHGGSGGGPFYIVHLTEQETMGIIRAQLESAGLNFNSRIAAPDYSYRWWDDTLTEIELFDPNLNVAIAQLDNQLGRQGFGFDGERVSEAVREELEEQAAENNDPITFGVFFSEGVGSWETDGWTKDSRPLLEEKLAAKIDAFVTLLKQDGVLQ
jgi:hypothetical protein